MISECNSPSYLLLIVTQQIVLLYVQEHFEGVPFQRAVDDEESTSPQKTGGFAELVSNSIHVYTRLMQYKQK